MTKYASVLERLTEGRELPEGTDRWALKATDFAGRTRNGFQWPIAGWVEASGPFSESDDPCPDFEGDGICVALTYAGMASGGHRALSLLLVAYADADRLSVEDEDKVRLKRAYVVKRLDGETVLKECGRGANLGEAYLVGANLVGANLVGANLGGADLGGADLRGADLVGANLREAYLVGANLGEAYLAGGNLAGAYLVGANLGEANLVGANLGEANLRGADLRGAYLRGADLGEAYLRGARASTYTAWPEGFDAKAAGVIL